MAKKDKDEDCIFCKIADKEMDSHSVYEDDKTMAFLDINPVAKGHTVVIPKIHAEYITDLNEEEVKHLFTSAQEVMSLIDKKLKPDGFNVGFNHRSTAGQAVPHLHVHVIPRYEGDGGGSMHSIVRHPPDEELEKIREKIIGK